VSKRPRATAPNAQRSHERQEEQVAEAWANIPQRSLASFIEASGHPMDIIVCNLGSSKEPPVYG